VPDAEAVRDHPAAADLSLEDGLAGGRVDEHVRGGQQVAHPVGEPEHPDPPLRAEPAREPAPHPLAAAAEADDGGALDLEGLAGRSLEVADRPAAPRDEDHRLIGRQVESAAGGLPRARPQKIRGGRRLGPDGAPRAGYALDLLDRLLVDHRVHVDPGMGPPLKSGEVGDRRHGRHLEPTAQPELAEQRGHPWIGGYDDIGIVSADGPQQTAGTDERERLLEQAAGWGDPGQERVGQLERPGGHPEEEVGAVPDNKAREASEHL
jgi:hypothetical protein